MSHPNPGPAGERHGEEMGRGSGGGRGIRGTSRATRRRGRVGGGGGSAGGRTSGEQYRRRRWTERVSHTPTRHGTIGNLICNIMVLLV